MGKKPFKNLHNISFDIKNDIIDITYILKKVDSLNIDDQKRNYEFIRKELGEVDVVKLESNLSTIINLLAKEDLNNPDNTLQTNAFEIDKKITYNDLNNAKIIIDEYRIYYSSVNKKYNELDKMGYNKSMGILAKFQKEYAKIKTDIITPDDLFFKIIENIISEIEKSANFSPIPNDELELCVNILAVDAFIRCKIFENPEQYNYVTP